MCYSPSDLITKGFFEILVGISDGKASISMLKNAEHKFEDVLLELILKTATALERKFNQRVSAGFK